MYVRRRSIGTKTPGSSQKGIPLTQFVDYRQVPTSPRWVFEARLVPLLGSFLLILRLEHVSFLEQIQFLYIAGRIDMGRKMTHHDWGIMG